MHEEDTFNRGNVGAFFGCDLNSSAGKGFGAD